MKTGNGFQIVELQSEVLRASIFCQFQTGVAYKSVAFKKACISTIKFLPVFNFLRMFLYNKISGCVFNALSLLSLGNVYNISIHTRHYTSPLFVSIMNL